PAKMADGLSDQTLRRFRFGEIADHSQSLTAGPRNRLTGRFRRARVSVTSDICAGLGERDGNRLSQPGRWAGHERGRSFDAAPVNDHRVSCCRPEGKAAPARAWAPTNE